MLLIDERVLQHLELIHSDLIAMDDKNYLNSYHEQWSSDHSDDDGISIQERHSRSPNSQHSLISHRQQTMQSTPLPSLSSYNDYDMEGQCRKRKLSPDE